MKILFRILLSGMLIFLGGCQQYVELHRNLSEQDANEVIAELAYKHIEAEKSLAKDGVIISVDMSDMARAVRILEAAGLPRKSRANLGDIFRKEGVISSPLEERARYIYALSQELESTISQIDGVLVARVHVVLPERVAPGEPVQPASAAVFIKHRPALDPDVMRPRITRLVQTSIPGLSGKKDKLSVVFIPAQAYREQIKYVSFGPFLMKESDAGFWQSVVICSGLIVLILSVVMALWLRPGLRPSWPGRRQKQSGQ
ncbi:type III secretion system inner membrane ring lipoprotein SctJ [Vibrio quintilis]|uniref:Lipoprotein n=1 Tax=Vibrio quintilis TaxID=1117707 RepID=A0A1M7YW38_9VIBR|nr:type III secretion inner membrane ring lipoprotein SctJ [Vibrio quintilis]SHO56775.1 Yop proteins translocation lipoprotein J precursor [Vibrio quintilis]